MSCHRWNSDILSGTWNRSTTASRLRCLLERNLALSWWYWYWLYDCIFPGGRLLQYDHWMEFLLHVYFNAREATLPELRIVQLHRSR